MKKPSRSFDSPDQQQTIEQNRHLCHVTGCCLPGTWSDNTKGEGPWICFVHAALKASSRDYVTAKIHENLWIYRLYERVLACDQYGWQSVNRLAAQFCVDRNERALAPAPDEKKSAYERRLRTALEMRCRQPGSTQDTPKKALVVPNSSATRVAELLPMGA